MTSKLTVCPVIYTAGHIFEASSSSAFYNFHRHSSTHGLRREKTILIFIYLETSLWFCRVGKLEYPVKTHLTDLVTTNRGHISCRRRKFEHEPH